MSALGRLRLPLAAFVAAALGGLALGFSLQGDDERSGASRARVPDAVTTELRRAPLPATPALRLGAPATAAPVAVAPPAAQPSAPAGQGSQEAARDPVTPQAPAAPQQGSGGLDVEEETVVSP